MGAVITAMFDEYRTADRARLDLVRDGFPTDRVDLTAGCEPGRAAFALARSPHEMLVRHFRTMFSADDEQAYVEHLARRIEDGGAALTVHPRGPLETTRAREILEGAHPRELAQHGLAHQWLEHAAVSHARPWIQAFWIESDHASDCIYCRLLKRLSH
ncbi:MAG: hypothetical protein WBE92_06745 [Steroidobacteraceae bacterium]